MDVGIRTTAEVVDFAAYRAKRQQRTLWEEQVSQYPRSWADARQDPLLSDRQLAHRRRMLAFLLTPR